TIFAKIDEAQVFVCDVSVINVGSAGRSTPNPNVLIELGYAIRKLGFSRIIMVMNSSFGSPEQLPFDLRMRRVITYEMPEGAEQRAPERRRLQTALEQGLRSILSALENEAAALAIPSLSPAEQARQAVEGAQARQEALVRRYMQSLASQISEMAPDLSRISDP